MITWVRDLLRRESRRASSARREAERRRVGIRVLIAAMVILILAFVGVMVLSMPSAQGREIRYDQLVSDLRQGRIEAVTVLTADRRIQGTDGGQPFWVAYGQDSSPLFTSLMTLFEQDSVPVSVDDQFLKPLLAGPFVSTMLLALILADVMVLAYLIGQGGLHRFARSGSRRVAQGESAATFADVAGADEALAELTEVRDFLAMPDRFRALGARVPRGVLLVGPPGCGKTLMARAVAGECEARFFSISGSSFVEMYAGVGAARIRDLFEEAQEAAPAIIFIDELDAVGRGRASTGGGDQAERESTLNQLLVALDGFDANSGVVIIAATNRPDILDPALLRPGRFDRHVNVDLPDVAGRHAILAVHLRDKPLADGVDLDALARRTAGLSGADLAGVANEAALLAARSGADALAAEHFWEAVERQMAGPRRRSRLLTPREKELAAYHEAGHAVVSAALTPEDRVGKISVVARGAAGGFTWYYAEEERVVATSAELMNKLARMMGGRAAEEIVVGDCTTAAQDDLEKATALARRIAGEFGMGERLGPISLKMTSAWLELPLAAGASPEMTALFDEEVRSLLNHALTRARTVVTARRSLLDRLARRLLEAETLEGDELDALLRGPRAAPQATTA